MGEKKERERERERESGGGRGSSQREGRFLMAVKGVDGKG